MVAPHRRKVEPFMRDDEVCRHVPPGRIKHPEFEQGIGRAGLRPQLDFLRSADISIRAIPMPPGFHSPDTPCQIFGWIDKISICLSFPSTRVIMREQFQQLS